MSRFFHTDNATLPVRVNGYDVKFKPCKQFAGTWNGVAEVDESIAPSLLVIPGIKEIQRQEYEDVLGKKIPTINFSSGFFHQKKGTAIVQLHRHGDIINVLPVAKAIHDRTGTKPGIVCTRDFIGILDGVSYVEPVLWMGSPDEAVMARDWAREQYENVLVSQLHGKGFITPQTEDSFSVESWKSIGFEKEYAKLPLVFDQRNRARENALVSKIKWDKPVILVNMDGISSPFKHSDTIRKELKDWDGMANVVDMYSIRAERVYDLIALFERASVLVTIDTMHLHLAAASRIGTCAFISDHDGKKQNRWRGTKPQCRTIFECRYSDANTEKAINALHSAIASEISSGRIGGFFEPKVEFIT